jgi:hypothetical protein
MSEGGSSDEGAGGLRIDVREHRGDRRGDASSLRARGLEVQAVPVPKIEPAEAARVDLLVVGGPTHAHGMSRSSTRRTAVDDKKNTFAEPTIAPGLREWMDGLPSGAERLAAAFGTRIDKPAFLTGSAAKGIARRLKHHGYRLVVGPESFLVSMNNTLLEGGSRPCNDVGCRAR